MVGRGEDKSVKCVWWGGHTNRNSACGGCGFIPKSVTRQACEGGEKMAGLAGATDRDAGRTLEGSGRVSGGQDEGDCAGMGGSGGGREKKR